MLDDEILQSCIKVFPMCKVKVKIFTIDLLYYYIYYNIYNNIINIITVLLQDCAKIGRCLMLQCCKVTMLHFCASESA